MILYRLQNPSGLKELDKHKVTLWRICSCRVSAVGSGVWLLFLIHSPACQQGQTWKKCRDKVPIWSASFLGEMLFTSVPLARVFGSDQRIENPLVRLGSQQDREKAAFQPEHRANWQKTPLLIRMQVIPDRWTILRALLKLMTFFFSKHSWTLGQCCRGSY